MRGGSVILGGSLALAAAGGCHAPDGGWMPYTGSSITYYSTPDRPTTVTIVDTRTEEPFFTIEVPVGRQLTLDFAEGRGDDPLLTPDLMRYDIWPIGTTVGFMRSSVTVPGARSRRIDVAYRPAPETVPEPSDRELRVDEAAEQPDWWSPRGGRRPGNPAQTMYDR